MEITHIGHACFRLRGKTATLVIDPYDPQMVGLKMPKLTADAVLCTHSHGDHHYLEAVEEARVVIDGPGEYEVSQATILGIPASHGADRGSVTIYRIQMDGLVLVHLGDLGEKLKSEQLDELNEVDILMVPVGGRFTLDAGQAAEVVAQIEPKIVIPMHYKVEGLAIEIGTKDAFLKEMGKEEVRPQPKLVITKEKLPPEMEVVVLE